MKIKDWMKLGFGVFVAINTYTFTTCVANEMLKSVTKKLEEINKSFDSKPENEEES